MPKSDFTQRISKFAYSKLKNKESTCAKYHWSVFREFTGEDSFLVENEELDISTNFLDYGYAVLLNLVLQELLAYGLDPQFGVGHAVRERSAPLAYDVIEPFRPIVDYHLAHFVNSEKHSLDNIKPFKKLLASAMERKYPYKGRSYDLASLVEQTCLSLRKAILSKNPSLSTMDGKKFKMGWMIVAFDLPVLTKEQKKVAAKFRKYLLNDGYMMIQFSFYARPTVTHSLE